MNHIKYLKIPQIISDLVIGKCRSEKQKNKERKTFSYNKLFRVLCEFVNSKKRENIENNSFFKKINYNSIPSADNLARVFGAKGKRYISYKGNENLADLLCLYAVNIKWEEFARINQLTNNDLDAQWETKKIKFKESLQKIIENEIDLIPFEIKIKIVNFETELKQLYNKNDTVNGITIGNQKYEIYKEYLHHFPKVLNLIFRFNSQAQSWKIVEDITTYILLKNCSPKTIACCKFSLCDINLRQAYLFRDKFEISKNFTDNAIKHLNEVPSNQQNYHEYYYLKGRCNLHYWFLNPNNDIIFLNEALSNFKRSFISNNKSWWSNCYICIVKVILHNINDTNSKFPLTEINQFKATLFSLEKELQSRSSVKSYQITAFILKNDKKGLENFLIINKNNTPNSGFQSSIYYHLNLIFHNDNQKFDLYKAQIDKWILNANNEA